MKILNHPNKFKQGVRILILTLRAKDGGKVTKPDRVARKMISRNEQEFDECLNKLNSIAKENERIYATADPRDMEKGIRIFKERQLEADYYDTDSKYSFYTDIANRWISALQSPKARIGTTFLVDVDYEENDVVKIKNEIKDNNIKIDYEYKTKNGEHLILQPFNPGLVSFSCAKNAMMLWGF